jgi:hypothetical protein
MRPFDSPLPRLCGVPGSRSRISFSRSVDGAPPFTSRFHASHSFATRRTVGTPARRTASAAASRSPSTAATFSAATTCAERSSSQPGGVRPRRLTHPPSLPCSSHAQDSSWCRLRDQRHLAAVSARTGQGNARALGNRAYACTRR